MVVYTHGVDTCGIASAFSMAFPILWMIREGSSVDAPFSFEVSVPCTLARHHASHVPCDVSSRGAVSCCRRRLCCLGLPMLTKDLLHFYFGIHTPALCYQLRVFSALRFSRIPAAQALCADVDNPSKCGVISLHGRRSFEAARNDAALASVPFLPKHTYADCPLRRIAALLWYPSPCLVCMFSCGQAAQFLHS